MNLISEYDLRSLTDNEFRPFAKWILDEQERRQKNPFRVIHVTHGGVQMRDYVERFPTLDEAKAYCEQHVTDIPDYSAYRCCFDIEDETKDGEQVADMRNINGHPVWR